MASRDLLTDRSGELLLAFLLPIGGQVAATSALGVALISGVPEHQLDGLLGALIFVVGLPLGVYLASWASPRVVPFARRYSTSVRLAAGLIGTLALVLTTNASDGWSLDERPYPPQFEHVVLEGLRLVATFGTMILTAWFVLWAFRGDRISLARQHAAEQ
jgi:hypothetical protein